jgi:hypothetical protein
MTEQEMKRKAKDYADEAIQTNAWGEEEKEFRWKQMYYSRLSVLCAAEAQRLRGEK